MKKIIVTVALLLCLCGAASAQILHGEAPLENGNIIKAREAAKNNALRTALEDQIGVMVKSKTITVNSMLVSDVITANALGYASVRGIVREGRTGEGTYFVDVDADLSPDKIKATANDLKARLAAVRKERGQVAVAVVGKSISGILALEDMNKYVEAKMQDYGFAAQVDDKAREYLDSAYSRGASATQIQNEARRIVREDGKQAILRGELSVVGTQRGKPAAGWYTATVKASFQLVRTDSDTVNSFMNTFSAYGASESEAESNALELATKTAVQSIAEKALETVQDQQVGGETVHEFTVRVMNVTASRQRKAVKDALKNAGCEISNETQSVNGDYIFLVETTLSYSDLTDVLEEIPGAHNKIGGNAADIGVKEIVLTY